MGGTVAGGINARNTNIEKYGKDFYRSIGALGGITKNPNKGFGGNRELARLAGAYGGMISRRKLGKGSRKAKHKVIDRKDLAAAIARLQEVHDKAMFEKYGGVI